MKKRVTAILLLFCLISAPTVTFIWLKHQKAIIRKEVKQNIIAGMDRDDLVLIKIAKSSQKQLKWKHSKEFEYQHQMYDVVKKEIHGDSCYYYCWWDNSETVLNKKLSQLVVSAWNNDKKSNTLKHKLSKLFKSLYCNNINKLENFTLEIGKEKIAFLPVKYTFNANSPPTPPPQKA